MDGVLAEAARDFRVRARGRLEQRVQRGTGIRLTKRFRIPLGGGEAAKILVRHGDAATRQIAEVIRQVRIAVLDQLLERELAVASGRDAVQQIEAQRVDTEAIGELEWIHHVA